MTPGPLLVWSGEERLATISTNAGSWDHGKWNQGGELKHMFDENPKTFWHCREDFVYKTKVIKIEFKVSLAVSHNYNLSYRTALLTYSEIRVPEAVIDISSYTGLSMEFDKIHLKDAIVTWSDMHSFSEFDKFEPM